MSNDIRLSPKHGLNPTIPICAFCGKQKNEIALMGRIGDGRKGEDFEAPRNVILDYEPCDECKAQWEQGVAIIEVSRYPVTEGQPPIAQGAYPTGRVAVVKEEALNGGFKKGSKALMLAEEYQKMFAASGSEA